MEVAMPPNSLLVIQGTVADTVDFADIEPQPNSLRVLASPEVRDPWMTFEDRRIRPMPLTLESFAPLGSDLYNVLLYHNLPKTCCINTESMLRIIGGQWASLYATRTMLLKRVDKDGILVYDKVKQDALQLELRPFFWYIEGPKGGKGRKRIQLWNIFEDAYETLTYQHHAWIPQPPYTPQHYVKPHTFNTFAGFQFPATDEVLLKYNLMHLKDLSFDEVEEYVEGTTEYRHFSQTWFAEAPELMGSFFKWVGDMFVNPASRVPTVYVFIGPQGAGKTIMIESFLQIVLGEALCVSLKTLRDLQERFNEHTVNKMLTVVEEASGSELHKAAENDFKFLTGNKKQRVEAKFKEAYIEDNYSRYIAICNTDEWGSSGWELPADNRRVIPIQLPGGKMNPNRAAAIQERARSYTEYKSASGIKHYHLWARFFHEQDRTGYEAHHMPDLHRVRFGTHLSEPIPVMFLYEYCRTFYTRRAEDDDTGWEAVRSATDIYSDFVTWFHESARMRSTTPVSCDQFTTNLCTLLRIKTVMKTTCTRLANNKRHAVGYEVPHLMLESSPEAMLGYIRSRGYCTTIDEAL